MRHVDIVSNDWSHAQQLRVARCQVSDDELQVDAQKDPDGWRDFVNERLERFGGARTANQKLEVLEDAIRGDYLFATAPHDDSACPYQADAVALPPVAVRDDARSHSRR